MKKNKWNNVLKAIVFTFLIAFIVYYVIWVFSPKEMAFYSEPSDEYEVLFFGSSAVYTSVNPLVMFEEEGIKSYSLARPEQALSHSYYYIEEALKYQKPKLVVVDLYSLFFHGEYPDDINPAGGVAAASINGMRLTNTKQEMIEATIKDEEDWQSYVLPWISNHNDWKTGLSRNNFYKDSVDFFGYVPSYTANDLLLKSIQNPYIETWPSKLNENNLKYLEKIISLCEEKDVELLFIKTPQIPDWNYTVNMHVGLEQYCENNQIFVLNFNDNEELADVMNYATDYSDGTHMNITGAEHFSAALADYIVKNYPDIIDYRNAGGNERWYEEIEKLEALTKEYMRGDITPPEEEPQTPDTDDEKKESIWPWITQDEDFIEWFIEKLTNYNNNLSVHK